jgi:hypothetical protein
MKFKKEGNQTFSLNWVNESYKFKLHLLAVTSSVCNFPGVASFILRVVHHVSTQNVSLGLGLNLGRP